MMKPRIKICCIISKDEANSAIDFGASAIGLVGKMPSGPGIIPDKLIYQIAQSTPPSIGTFLLTSKTSANGIIQHHQKTHTNTIQIVDRIKKDTYQQLRQSIPAIKLVQVVHIIDGNSVEEAIEVSEYVDAVLLDSGNPDLEVKELGGTGRVHNWKLSRRIRDNVKIPIFLAGGLGIDNVKQAIDEVQPFGLDLCTSVRTNGKLDKRKLERFFNTVFY